MFPERTNICSAVRLDGFFLSYSLIGNPAHLRDFGKSTYSVSAVIIFSSRAAANVKV